MATIASRLSETAAAAKADTLAPTAAALGGLRAIKREDGLMMMGTGAGLSSSGFDSVLPTGAGGSKKLEKFTLDADGNLIDSEGKIVQTERNVTSLKVNQSLFCVSRSDDRECT